VLAAAEFPETRKYWVATWDNRARPHHLEADQATNYEHGGMPIGVNAKFTVGGHKCLHPHDPNLPPEESVNCRCGEETTLLTDADINELYPNGAVPFAIKDLKIRKRGLRESFYGHAGRPGKRGGSLPRSARSGIVYDRKLDAKISQYADTIRNNNFETCACFDKDGNVLFEHTGILNRVTTDYRNFPKIKDNIFIHNHPMGRSFSQDDVLFGIVHNAKEIRIVGKKFDYSLSRSRGRWPKFNYAKYKYMVLDNSVFKSMNKLIKNNKISVERAEFIHQDIVMRKFAKYFGLKYKKTEVWTQ